MLAFKSEGIGHEAAEVFEQDPSVEGLILHKHGIFTFGESAREAYERMIEMVSAAEAALRRGRRAVFATAQLPIDDQQVVATGSNVVCMRCATLDGRNYLDLAQLVLQ